MTIFQTTDTNSPVVSLDGQIDIGKGVIVAVDNLTAVIGEPPIGSPAQILVDGTVESTHVGITVFATNGSDIVGVGAAGSVSAVGAAIDVLTATESSLSNAGAISSLTACAFIGQGHDSIVNTGSLSGFTGAIDDNGDDNIVNAGTLSSQGDAIYENTGDDAIKNSGVISSLGAAAIVIAGGKASTLTNSGHIDGDVDLDGAGSSLTDSGTIDGAVTLAGGTATAAQVRLGDDGIIDATVGTALSISGGLYDIVNSGDIEGAADGVDVDSSGDIVNYGKIVGGSDGIVATGAGILTIANYGAIAGDDGIVLHTGDLTGIYASGTRLSVVNSGKIEGGVELYGSSVSLVNTGEIDDGINENGAQASLENSGTVNGLVEFYSGGTLSNSGLIDGEVAIGGSAATLIDNGTIDGGASVSGGYENATTHAVTDAEVRIGDKGVLETESGGAALLLTGGYADIVNKGQIDSASNANDADQGAIGVEIANAAAPVTLVNRGDIFGADAGVEDNGQNGAGAANDFLVLNYGDIEGDLEGVDATLSGYARIANYGTLAAADANTDAYAIDLNSAYPSTLFNRGSVDGAILGVTTIDNSGAIDGAIFMGSSADLVNAGLIDGDVYLSGVDGRIRNSGRIDGAVKLTGTDLTFDGRGGEVSGEILILTSNFGGAYYAGGGAETFNFVNAAPRLVVAGNGDDTFIFNQNLTMATTIIGDDAGPDDVLQLFGPSTAGESAIYHFTRNDFAHVSGIETLDIGSSFTEVSLTNALVSSAHDATLTVAALGSSDFIDASGVTGADDRVIVEAGADDVIYAGGGVDVFDYQSVSDSDASSINIIQSANFSRDSFVLPGTGSSVKSPITVASYNTNKQIGAKGVAAWLSSILAGGSPNYTLGANTALLLDEKKNGVTEATYLIVNPTATAGYSPTADLVVQLIDYTGKLTAANFT